VLKQEDGYALCSHGQRECQSGKWGACRPLASGGAKTFGVRPLFSGTNSKCTTENPCDPYCHVVNDTPEDVASGGAGGVASDGEAVTLPRAPADELPSWTCESLVVTATPSRLRVTQLSPVAPSSVQLTASLLPEGCWTGAVPALFAIDRYDIATVSSDGVLTLVTPVAGPIQITAYAGELSATTTVNVVVDVQTESAAPPGTGSYFPDPVDAPSVCDFALLSESTLRLGSDSQIKAAPVGGADVELKQGAYAEGATSSGPLILRNNAVVKGAAKAAGAITVSSGATVTGTSQPNTSVTLPPAPSKTLTCAGANQTINGGSSATLAPGAYGKVVVKPGGTLTLQAGTYSFKEFTVGANGGATGPKLIFPSTGTVIINVCDDLLIGNAADLAGVSPGADAARIQWYFGGTNPVAMKNGAEFFGILSAPNAEVALDSSVTAYALIQADSIDLGPNALVDATGLSGAACAATGIDAPVPTSSIADTVELLYPYANTVFPLGLRAPLVMWRTGTNGAASAVRIAVQYPANGTPTFRWAQVISESRTLPLNPPTNSITLAAGPRATIPQSVWETLEQTAQGRSAMISVQRLTGTTLRAEQKIPVRFATGQLKGTVYYQSYGTLLVQNYGNTYGSQTIGANQRFGAATLAVQPGTDFPTVAAGYTSSSDGPGCRVCHSASANGTRLITNLHTGANSALFRLGTDAASGGLSFTPTPNNGRYAWGALSPDGSLLFSNSGPSSNYSSTAPPGGLEGSDSGSYGNALYSLATTTLGGAVSSTGIPSALRAALPVFSPDGTKVAFNHYGGTVSGIAGDKRSLGMMDVNLTTRTFSNFRRLFTEPTTACNTAFHATDPCTSVWPSFVPGGSAVVFQREVFNNGRVSGSNHSDFGGTRSGCDGSGTCGDDGTKGELWWVTTAASPVAARLNAANGRNSAGVINIPTGANNHSTAYEPVLNYEPTVNPVAAGGYYWVAFTSRRLYGNVATVNPWWSDPRFKPIGGQHGPTTKKIWVAAIDPNAAPGTDASFPAFYLPGQELLAGNSKAYWANEACRAPSNTRSSANECQTNLDCCGAPSTAICALQTPIANPPVRHCIPLSSASCIADESATACTTDGQCCGFSTGSRCANGSCQKPPPIELFVPAQFSRDYVAECEKGTKSVWQVFQWKADVPSGTSIVFSVATSATEAGLASATFVSLEVVTDSDSDSWSTSAQTVTNVLRAAGIEPQSHLKVKMELLPDAARGAAPRLVDWRQIYQCVDAE
jgi:hypothetical protein